ncbi:hypothetical protein Tco_0401285 [Tanacetum coccineum]
MKHRANSVALKETKMESMDLVTIKALANRAEGLWDYLHLLIDRWECEYVILGDFSEVRSEHERFGSLFNVQGANAFNNFISMANLIDLPLEGFINIEDSIGMIKFKKKLQALKYLVKHWSINAKSNSFKAKITIQSKLSDINKILDQGGSNENILNTRSMLLKELNDINTVDSLEKAKKGKIRWAIKGDENS